MDPGSPRRAFGELTNWEQQLRFAEALPWRTSPIELHDLLVALLVDERLGELATSIIVRHMSWPLQYPELAARFERLAAKEGETAGTLVTTLVGRPTEGSRAGTDRIVVLSLHDMDLETWTSARDNGVYQALALQLAEDASFATELQEALDQ